MISERKRSHLEICRKENVEFDKSAGFDSLELRHNALPECDLSEIDVSCELLGKKLSAPLMISAMTGGVGEGEKINKELAALAQKLGLGFGVGSQRAAIEDAKLARTYEVRDVAPDVLLLGNLGLAQFVVGYGEKEAEAAMEMIDADALAIHLNAAQEAAQPEGDTNWKGGLEAIRKLKVPVVAKEVGAGINGDVGARLESVGVKAIDVGGAGGTSWTKVEHYRGAGTSLSEWGLPTAQCLLENRDRKIPLIATGGVRSGQDVAKAIVLGATACGMALPVLRAWYEGRAEDYLKSVIEELKKVMFLTGCQNLAELREGMPLEGCVC